MRHLAKEIVLCSVFVTVIIEVILAVCILFLDYFGETVLAQIFEDIGRGIYLIDVFIFAMCYKFDRDVFIVMWTDEWL